MDVLRREEMREEYLEKASPIARALAKVRHKIAVMSGKGGVGKTSVTVNLATVLAERGWRVGILDADVHGPSVPKMLGVTEATDLHGSMYLHPVKSPYGPKVMSVALFWPGDYTPVMWRGQYKARMLRQLLGGVRWGELDFLLVDLPPGTGDEPLTVMKSIPGLDGVVVVTTPQEVAAVVCGKAVNSARELGVRVLGIVENMSTYICPHCGKESPLFGEGRAEELARVFGLRLLGRIPFAPGVARAHDRGLPAVVADPGGPVALSFRECASEIVKVLNP